MKGKELVRRAVDLEYPSRIPILFFNRDKEKSDIVMIDVCHQYQGEDQDISEWGFQWEKCDDSMGQPLRPIIETMEDLENYRGPDPYDPERFRHTAEEMEKYPGQYYLASTGLSGFTIMTCLHGFAQVLEDMYIEEEFFHALADLVFGFEEQVILQLKDQGFHGVAFFDDWGTQNNLIISPDKWREVFKPRYARQFQMIHEQGMDVYFHCCGAIEAIIPDLIEIGVDMLNISQPNLFDIEELGEKYSGKICFVCPVSYQTTSINGTKEMIRSDVRALVENLGNHGGGLIGYIEDYRIMGMSEENYQACVEAFQTIGAYGREEEV